IFGRISIRCALMSRRPNSNTANRPTGPAPIMTTSVSMLSMNLNSPSGSPQEHEAAYFAIRHHGSAAHRGQGHLEPIEVGRPQDLAGEARVRLRDRHHVELAFLLLGRREKLRQPFFRDEDVAGGALAGTTA